MIYLSNKKILANIFVSTTNDHPVDTSYNVVNRVLYVVMIDVTDDLDVVFLT